MLRIVTSCIFVFHFFGQNQDQQIFLLGHFLLFTGVMFDSFYDQDLNFYVSKLNKIFTSLNPFSLVLFRNFWFFHDQPTLSHAKKIIKTHEGSFKLAYWIFYWLKFVSEVFFYNISIRSAFLSCTTLDSKGPSTNYVILFLV